MLVYGLPHTNSQPLPTSTPTPQPSQYSDPSPRVTYPTPSPYTDPRPRVTYPTIFSPLSTPTYNIFTKGLTQALPTHHRHPYANTVFGFPFSRSLPHDFSRLTTTILTYFTEGFTQALPTSIVTPTRTQQSVSPPRVTHPRIFPVSLPQFTPLLYRFYTGTSYLQHHTYDNVIFAMPSSHYPT